MTQSDPIRLEPSHPEPLPNIFGDHDDALPKLTSSEIRELYVEKIFRVLEEVGTESRGQPPRVDRFREVARLADQLEAQGVPFGVSSTSIMNRRVRERLNAEAARSTDARKSRRKQITPAAVRKWLREVRRLRARRDHFTEMYPNKA
jgi:hypothetical protein